MKKCASCTKDLPDAALHCVFCGAKQAPAPATAGGMAKTQMGAYSASDMMEHLKQQGGAGPAPRPAPAAAPYAPPRAQPPSQPQPPSGPAPYQNYPAPGPARGPGPAPQAPAAGAQAPTMFVPGGGPPQGQFGPGPGPAQPQRPPMHQPGPMGPGPSAPAPMPPAYAPAPMPPAYAPAPYNPQPVAPIPSAIPPYLASQTAARAGRPIEPWKDTLRMMMFVWGGVLLAAFAVPIATDPMVFNWNLIIDGEGTAKLPPLILAAAGLLAIVIAGIPMSPVPRGMIAALIGLAGVLTPLILVLSGGADVPWQVLVQVAGFILLIPSLFVRQEYRDASLPRILITVGAIAILLPELIPVNDSLPLVAKFKALIDAPGTLKVLVALQLAQIVIVVLALLAWLPSPSSGGAMVFAWLLILWPLLQGVAGLLLGGNVLDSITGSPNQALLGWAPESAYAVLIGFGLATVIGKKLE